MKNTEEYNEKIAIEIEGWTQSEELELTDYRGNHKGWGRVWIDGEGNYKRIVSDDPEIRARAFPEYHKDAEALLRAVESLPEHIDIGRTKADMYSALCQYVDSL